jgi:hypothetical protein
MKALEFEARLGPEKTLTIPEEVASQLSAGQVVRVLVLVDQEDEDERAWKMMGVRAFLKGDGDDDAIYDQFSPR